jgi:hypothetical protein
MILEKTDRDYLLNDGKPILDWYVYGWVNEDWGGVYFYVGKGHGNRYKDTKQRGQAFRAIYENWNCFPVILEDSLTEEEAEIREVEIKEEMIFEKGFPIMDGEGHSETLKHLACQRAKREKRKNDPNYREGRPRVEIPDDFMEYVAKNEAGEISIAAACKEMGVARAHWYRWKKACGQE